MGTIVRVPALLPKVHACPNPKASLYEGIGQDQACKWAGPVGSERHNAGVAGHCAGMRGAVQRRGGTSAHVQECGGTIQEYGVQ